MASGTSYEYELTSITSPASGHVQAFAVAASGVASGTASWDAGDPSLMSTATRNTKLYSTDTSGNVVALSSLDSAAFALSATSTCIPNVATIVSYRKEHGAFADFDALAGVPGVDRDALEKKRDALVF